MGSGAPGLGDINVVADGRDRLCPSRKCIKSVKLFCLRKNLVDGEHNYGRGAEPGAQARLGGHLGPPGFGACRAGSRTAQSHSFVTWQRLPPVARPL